MTATADPPTLWMAHTAKGLVAHLAAEPVPGTFTLCSRRVDSITRNYRTGQAVPYAPHWDDDAVTGPCAGGLCVPCAAAAERLARRAQAR